MEGWALLAGDCKVCSSLPFMEAPEWWNCAMPKQGLRQKWHGCDLVKLMDRIFVAIVVDDKGEDRLRGDRRHGTESRHVLVSQRSGNG